MNGRLTITAGHKYGRSYLKESYCTQPFKLSNVTEDKSSPVLQLMLMSSSPGILDNDKYAIDITVEENAAVQLSTQGYQRLFQMTNKAEQVTRVSLANNASLCYLPHPTVPHASSSFFSNNDIHLSRQHHLLWSEIITCGRKLSGETFTLSTYKNVTNVYIENKLVVKENIVMKGSNKKLQLLGQLEGFTHQSTLLWLHDSAEVDDCLKACREYLESMEGILSGVSKLSVNGFIVRILGNKGEQLFSINNHLAQLIKAFLKPTALPQSIIEIID